mgnify:CR=1 FL=1
MTITTISNSQFIQDVSKAKRAAENGPVFITSDESPTHVLMTYQEYKKLSQTNKRISELLAMPGIADIELELPSRCDW